VHDAALVGLLEATDIDEALRYAASLAEDETIELVG